MLQLRGRKSIQRLAGNLRRMASESIRRPAKLRPPLPRDRHTSDMPQGCPLRPCEPAFLPGAPLTEGSPPRQTSCPACSRHPRPRLLPVCLQPTAACVLPSTFRGIACKVRPAAERRKAPGHSDCKLPVRFATTARHLNPHPDYLSLP